MNKEMIIGGVIIGAACAAAATWVIFDHKALQEKIALPQAQVALAAPKTPEVPQAAPPRPTPQQIVPQTQPSAPVIPQVAPQANRPAPRPNPTPAPAQAPISEPVAREALKSVGADAAAEDVWINAINDGSLSPNERKNLIEDLNETGFADPRNLTRNDLPLIENRIALIEAIGPDAMDDVNAAAFQEAYKDLVNMRARLVQQ